MSQAVYLACESRSSVAGSSNSKRPGGSVGWPVTSGAGVSGAGGGTSESGAASLGTSADSPRRLACPHCRELLAGKDALAAHVAEEHPSSSTTTTGSATSTAPLGCSEEAEGLKTHISTALGGLLDRALNNLLERGLSPGGSACPPSLDRPTLSLLQKLTARRPALVPAAASASVSPSSSRPAPVYNTELAKRVRGELTSRPAPPGLALLRAAVGAGPYVCFYCDERFEQQSSRNRHMVRTHKNEIISCKAKPEAEDEDDAGDASDSDRSWREPSPTNWTSETPGGDTGGDGDFLCSDCGINFGTPQEVLAHRKAEHSRPEPPPQEASARGRQGGRHGRGSGAGAFASGRAAPASPPDGETIKQQAMAALRELGAQSRRGGRGAAQAKWGMRFPLAPAPGAEGAPPVKQEKGAATTFSLPLVRKSSGPGPRFASLEKRRGKKAAAVVGADEASPGPSPAPARLDVYEFADEETLAERPELQRRPAAAPGPAEVKQTETKSAERPTTPDLSKEGADPQPEVPAGDAKEGDGTTTATGRPQRRERRRKSCADFPSDLSDVLDESDSDGAPRPPAVARASAAPRGGRRPRRGAGRGGTGRGGAGTGRRRGRGRGGGRRPAHTALAVTGAAPPAPVAVSASSDDDDEGDGPALPPAKVPCRAATPDDSSQSSCDVKGAAAGPAGAAARRRRRRAKSDLLISVFRAKARHVSVSAAAAADSSEDGAASVGAEPPV